MLQKLIYSLDKNFIINNKFSNVWLSISKITLFYAFNIFLQLTLCFHFFNLFNTESSQTKLYQLFLIDIYQPLFNFKPFPFQSCFMEFFKNLIFIQIHLMFQLHKLLLIINNSGPYLLCRCLDCIQLMVHNLHHTV